MSDLIEKFDVDGDVREAAEAAGVDRSSFIRGGALAGAGVVAGGALFGLPAMADATISTHHKSLKNDVKILNFALTLEYLEAEFYKQAVAANAFTATSSASVAQVARFAQVVAGHEKDHAAFLAKNLKKARVKKPKFDFGDATVGQKFLDTAVALEDTGVLAYSGQGANLKTAAYLRAAVSILVVEARHSSWARFINNGGVADAPVSALPAPKTFDSRRSEHAILARVKRTKFVKSGLSPSKI